MNYTDEKLIRENRLIIILGVIVVLFTLLYSMHYHPLNSILGYGDVTLEQGKNLIENNGALIVLDVRMDWEYDWGHINSAINIPLNELKGRLDELKPTTEILVYWGTGFKSTIAMKILTDNDFSKVYNMVAGYEAWKRTGY